jgi:hypothetical protein
MDSTESDATDKPFFEDMQDFVVWQARRLINNNLYTKSLLSSLPVPLYQVAALLSAGSTHIHR